MRYVKIPTPSSTFERLRILDTQLYSTQEALAAISCADVLWRMLRTTVKATRNDAEFHLVPSPLPPSLHPASHNV